MRILAGGTARVFLGNGDGSFQPRVAITDVADFYGVALGDLDNDGNPDVVNTRFDTNVIAVRLGNGDGTFDTAVTYPVGVGPREVALGDVNGDDVLDAVVTLPPPMEKSRSDLELTTVRSKQAQPMRLAICLSE